MTIMLVIFLSLHMLVHLLCLQQMVRFFELRPDLRPGWMNSGYSCGNVSTRSPAGWLLFYSHRRRWRFAVPGSSIFWKKS
jgi:hypothetical protein